ncbi:MAG: polyphosphate polymerase domain-containing protein [Anaerolineae bacterium]|nr:polyphosphate polymerase domain-containing protein [Anaerolineae bacterium]
MITDTRMALQLSPLAIFENAPDDIEHLLTRFSPIGLSEMEHVSLLNRVDTKYILGMRRLYAALEQMTGQYRVLEIEGMRANRYQTIYFDTPEFDLYRQHHNGFGTRYKVRARRYVDSNLAFFEVKHKNNQGRTLKSRYQVPRWQIEMGGQEDAFVDVHTPLDPEQLEPKLWNDYLRITLVSNHRQERVTLDLNLAFGWGDRWASLPGVVIAEVKQEHFSRDSDFIRQMRALGIQSSSFSKYCMGACMLYEHLKNNNFKPHLRRLHKVMQGELTYEVIH